MYRTLVLTAALTALAAPGALATEDPVHQAWRLFGDDTASNLTVELTRPLSSSECAAAGRANNCIESCVAADDPDSSALTCTVEPPDPDYWDKARLAHHLVCTSSRCLPTRLKQISNGFFRLIVFERPPNWGTPTVVPTEPTLAKLDNLDIIGRLSPNLWDGYHSAVTCCAECHFRFDGCAYTDHCCDGQCAEPIDCGGNTPPSPGVDLGCGPPYPVYNLQVQVDGMSCRYTGVVVPKEIDGNCEETLSGGLVYNCVGPDGLVPPDQPMFEFNQTGGSGGNRS